MKRYLRILFILVLQFHVVIGIAQDSLWLSSNRAFQLEEYDKAVEGYEKLAEDFTSPSLHSNLALAYYYRGELAPAILEMERAKRLAPFDKDINKNLKLLNENVESDVQQIPPFFLRAWLNGITSLFNPTSWVIINIFILMMVALLLYHYLIRNYTFNLHFYYMRGLIIGLACLFFISLGLAYNAHAMRMNATFAIVMQKKVPLRAGAEQNSQIVQALANGLKVKIEDEIGEFYKVKLGDYTEGWLDKSTVERI